VSVNIKDKETLSALNKKKEKQMSEITNHNTTKLKQLEEMIRSNKISKNRTEYIRIKAETNAVKIDNKHKKLVQDKLNGEEGRKPVKIMKK
jgi:lactam utilization protein B